MSVQTLADGTHIKHKARTETIYRDSEGRTRSERPVCQRPGEEPTGVIIEIRDPVSGYAYILDSQNQVAHRYAMKVSQRGPVQPPLTPAENAPATPVVQESSALRTITNQPKRPRPTFTTEPLGTQVIEGVMAEGTKTTEVIPVGMMENDGPITVVTERWFSAELKINILTKRSDPHGESTSRLINISVDEPDPSLFQPPADYKVVDETEPVKLTFTRP